MIGSGEQRESDITSEKEGREGGRDGRIEGEIRIQRKRQRIGEDGEIG